MDVSETDLTWVLDRLDVGIVIVDVNFKILWFNEPAHRITNMTAGDVGRPMAMALAEFTAADLSALAAKCVKKRRPCRIDVESSEGQWYSMSSTPNISDTGGIVGAILSFTNITHRKHTEEALREAEQRFRRTFDQSPIGAAMVGLDHRFLRVNDEMCRITGYSPEELTSLTFVDITHPDDVDVDVRNAEELRSGKIDQYQFDKRYIRNDGETVWVRSSVRMVKDANGEPLYFIPMIEDINDRKKAEQALIEAEQRYRTIAEFTYDWEYWQASTGEILFMAPSCERVTGYSPEEFIENPQLLEEIVHPDDRQLYANHMHSITELGEVEQIDFRIIRRDGEIRWIGHVCRAVQHPDGSIVSRRVSNRDITDQKLAQQLLSDSEARYRTLFEDSPVALIEEDWSSVKKCLDDLLKSGVTDLAAHFEEHPDAILQCISGTRTLSANRAALQLYGVGDIKYLRGMCRVPETESALKWMHRCLSSLASRAKVAESEYTEMTPSGKRLEVAVRLSVSTGSEETLGKVVLSVIDITERKRVEREREAARRTLEEIYQREHKIAETLQKNFLPEQLPEIEGYAVADVYEAALEEAAIGGDVYDIFSLPSGKIGIVIADVSGKGLPAARYGAMVKYMIHAYSHLYEDPAQVLEALNDSVYSEAEAESFVTCFYCLLEPERMIITYANAGHDPPLYIRRTPISVSTLDVTGSALGFQRQLKYTNRILEMRTGDMLLLYTDGVTDARGIEPRMGTEGLQSLLTENPPTSADHLLQSVLREVKHRSGNRLSDDVAIVVLEVMPRSGD